jgi:hypothetical protein
MCEKDRSKRAIRRHNTKKMHKKAKNIYLNYWLSNLNNELTESKINENVSRIRDNMADCSCPMCKNVRLSKLYSNEEKLTMQEKRAFLKEND